MEIIKRFMKFVHPYKYLMFLTIFLGVLKFLFPIFIPVIMKYTIDDILYNHSLSESDKMHHLFWLMGGVMILYILIRPFVEYYRQFFAHHTSNKILQDVRKVLFEHVQRLSMSYYARTKSGDIISRIIFDVEQAKQFIQTGLMNIWLDLVVVIISICIMLKYHVTLTLISLFIFPLYMFSVKFFYRRFKHATKERSKALAMLQSHLQERITGISAIISFARQKEEMNKFNEKNDAFFEKTITHAKRNAQTFSATNTIAEVAPLVVILMASVYVIKFDLTVGTLVAFVGLLQNLYAPLKRIADSSNVLTQSIASLERIYEFLDEPYEITDGKQASSQTIHRGDIVFENVSFSYQAGHPILNSIDLHIPAGKTFAFVGESGGGKSSLISLLPRFYEPTNGRLTIDGVDVQEFTLHSLRSQIGLVFQDNVLFNESVEENIRLGNPGATIDAIMHAAKLAQAHDFITELPNGYETEIGERGVKLSGGQKQRVAIARAFLKNPPILILDEATSALDLESEHHIQQALKEIAKNRTTLIVAHRLSTIVHADTIVYLANGEIKEMGSHEELMNLRGGYYDLFQIQHL